jgi:hypothetical protein
VNSSTTSAVLFCTFKNIVCSFDLSATSQQYFSLRTNQPPAISQQYFFSEQISTSHQPPNEQMTVLRNALQRDAEIQTASLPVWRRDPIRGRAQEAGAHHHATSAAAAFSALPLQRALLAHVNLRLLLHAISDKNRTPRRLDLYDSSASVSLTHLTGGRSLWFSRRSIRDREAGRALSAPPRCAARASSGSSFTTLGLRAPSVSGRGGAQE